MVERFGNSGLAQIQRMQEGQIDIPTQRIAGFDPLQEQAFQMAQPGEEGIGGYKPYLQDAQTFGMAATLAKTAAQLLPQQTVVAEEAVEEAHPKKLTATHEGVVIESREENRVGWTHRIPSIHARTCHGP